MGLASLLFSVFLRYKLAVPFHTDGHRRQFRRRPPGPDPAALPRRDSAHGRSADHGIRGYRDSALDQVLPYGGLPRGRLSAWAPYGGSTARFSAPPVTPSSPTASARHGSTPTTPWPARSGASGPYLVRPTSRLHALRAAEELLRSGGFSLLVLAGTEPQGTEPVRLTRAAREGGTALSPSARRRRWRACGSRPACSITAGAAHHSAIRRTPRTPQYASTREPRAGALTRLSDSGDAP